MAVDQVFWHWTGFFGTRPGNFGTRPRNFGTRPELLALDHFGTRPGNFGTRPGNFGTRPGKSRKNQTNPKNNLNNSRKIAGNPRQI